jgi:rod shape-determining protein MreD
LLALAAVPQAPIGLTLGQLLLTVAIYPLVAGLAHLALGLRRGPGEGDAATWP